MLLLLKDLGQNPLISVPNRKNLNIGSATLLSWQSYVDADMMVIKRKTPVYVDEVRYSESPFYVYIYFAGFLKYRE